MHRSIISDIYQLSGRRFDFAKDGLVVYNLGCGKQQYPGIIGVDWSKADTVDIRHDLNVHPWPIPDHSADVVLAFHFMEHVGDLFETFKEIHRISKPGARVIIEVPYFRSNAAVKDPTHIHFWTSKTVNYFCTPNHTYPELPYRFKLVDLSLGWPAVHSGPLKRWAKRWLKEHREFYDERLSMFFAVKLLVMELEVEK